MTAPHPRLAAFLDAHAPQPVQPALAEAIRDLAKEPPHG